MASPIKLFLVSINNVGMLFTLKMHYEKLHLVNNVTLFNIKTIFQSKLSISHHDNDIFHRQGAICNLINNVLKIPKIETAEVRRVNFAASHLHIDHSSISGIV